MHVEDTDGLLVQVDDDPVAMTGVDPGDDVVVRTRRGWRLHRAAGLAPDGTVATTTGPRGVSPWDAHRVVAVGASAELDDLEVAARTRASRA